MSADECAGIFAAASVAADAEIARVETRERRRREYYESEAIFLIWPKKLETLQDDGRTYVYPRYVNLGSRDYCWDRKPAPKGAVFRTAVQLGLDNTLANRHYDDKTYYDYHCNAEYDHWTIRKAGREVKKAERVIARTLACFHRRKAALSAFAGFHA
jgi:hypothetical protein